MMQHLENADFPSDPLNVGLIVDLFFFESFDGNLNTSGHVRGDSDLSEGALADCLA